MSQWPHEALQDLPLEVLTKVCQHLGLGDLVRVAQSSKRFGHVGLRSVKRVPAEWPAVAVLLGRAFSRPELIPRTRPFGCSESWVAYLARCVRQRRCREAPSIAAAELHSLFLDSAGRLLAFGEGPEAGHGAVEGVYFDPAPVAAMAGVRVRSVAAGLRHSLALTCDGRVYSWGKNSYGQLGHGDKVHKHTPTLVEGLEDVREIAAAGDYSYAVTRAGVRNVWQGFAPATGLRMPGQACPTILYHSGCCGQETEHFGFPDGGPPPLHCSTRPS
jgi:hypothetical protein